MKKKIIATKITKQKYRYKKKFFMENKTKRKLILLRQSKA